MAKGNIELGNWRIPFEIGMILIYHISARYPKKLIGSFMGSFMELLEINLSKLKKIIRVRSIS